jgi:hypothetical protein
MYAYFARLNTPINLGPVWIRGIYAIFVFSPKYILERKDDVLSRCDVTDFARRHSDFARPNDRKYRESKRPRFLRKYILAKIRK